MAGPDVAALRVGQVWTYRHRPQDQGSTLTIVKLDRAPNGDPIIHIRVSGLALRNPHTATGMQGSLPHLPLSHDAFARSVLNKQADQGALGDFESGYLDWRRNFDAGEGGIWTISVAEIVAVIEEAINPHSAADHSA